jgi:hypothetical protein
VIDFATIADFAAMDWRETRDQIDAMQANTRFPVEEIEKRRARLPLKAQAVHIVRIVAADADLREQVAKQMEELRK